MKGTYRIFFLIAQKRIWNVFFSKMVWGISPYLPRSHEPMPPSAHPCHLHFAQAKPAACKGGGGGAEAAKVHFSTIGLLTFSLRHTADSRTGGRVGKRRGRENFLMVSPSVEGSGRQLEGGKGDKKAFGNFRRLNLPNHVRCFFFFFFGTCDIPKCVKYRYRRYISFLKKCRNQVHRAFIWLWRGWRTLSGGDVHLVPTFFSSPLLIPHFRGLFLFLFDISIENMWLRQLRHPSISSTQKLVFFSAGVIFPQGLA